MAIGKVKWFNNAKGYGFVLPEGGGGDLFAHFSSIQMEGYKTLKAGQDVYYDVSEGPKGLHAVNIRAVAVAEPEQAAANGSAHDAGAEPARAPSAEPVAEPALAAAAPAADRRLVAAAET